METYCHHMVFQPHDHLPCPTSMPSKAIILTLAMGLTRQESESKPNVTRHQLNSYNLMHNQDSQLRYKVKQNFKDRVICS
jgi:hypothetical protein